MAELIEYEEKDEIAINIYELKKEVRFLKFLIFFFGIDLCFVTYLALKFGGIL